MKLKTLILTIKYVPHRRMSDIKLIEQAITALSAQVPFIDGQFPVEQEICTSYPWSFLIHMGIPATRIINFDRFNKILIYGDDDYVDYIRGTFCLRPKNTTHITPALANAGSLQGITNSLIIMPGTLPFTGVAGVDFFAEIDRMVIQKHISVLRIPEKKSYSCASVKNILETQT